MKALYRVIAALAAAAAFPALYFLKLVHVKIELGFTEGYFDDQFSLKQIIDFFSDKSGSGISPTVSSTLAPLKASAITTAVFLAIMLLMLLALIIFSAFTNKRLLNVCFSLIGAVSTIGAMAAFNHMTGLIINGTVGLGDIINAFLADSGKVLGGIASLLGLGDAVSVVGKLLVLRLDSAIILTLIIFIFVALWTAAFMLVDMDPNKGDIKKASKKK